MRLLGGSVVYGVAAALLAIVAGHAWADNPEPIDETSVTEFDGVDDFVSLGTDERLLFQRGDTIAISGWINPTHIDGYDPIVGRPVPCGNAGNYLVDFSGKHLRFCYTNTSQTTGHCALISDAPVSEGAWTHFAAVYRFGNAASFRGYINGELTNQGSWYYGDGNADPWTDPTHRVEAGRYAGCNSGSNYFYQGKMYQLAVYDRALSDKEIQDHYLRRAPPLSYQARASSTAAGYSLAALSDGDPRSIWLSSAGVKPENNFAWVELNLGGLYSVEELEWNSPLGADAPYPASAPSHYVIKLSVDGITWVPVAFGTESAGVYQKTEKIHQRAQFIRLETTRVNDGTGWALSFSEISVKGFPSGRETAIVYPAMNASATAPGYSLEHAVDGDPNTIWLASSQVSTNNNRVTVELSLPQVQQVAGLHWLSAAMPYPASAPAHFAVSVSSDGTNWSEVMETNGSAIYSGHVPIHRWARFVRLQTLTVNDGTGWALGLRDIWLTVKESQPKCDITLTPAHDFKPILDSLRGQPSSWTTVCLSGGTYEGPIRIQAANKLRIIGHNGIPVIRSHITPAAPVEGQTATFEIWSSQDIEISGITVANSYEYQPVSDQNFQVSRALIIAGTKNVKVSHATILSKGKQTIHYADNENLLFSNNYVRGYYFLLDQNRSDAYVYDTSFVTFARVAPNDQHTVLWVAETDLVLDDIDMIARTGIGVFSGVQQVSNTVTVKGYTKVFGLAHWIQRHPNYRNIKVNVIGTFPTLASYWHNNWLGGGPSPGTVICYYPRSRFERCEPSP